MSAYGGPEVVQRPGAHGADGGLQERQRHRDHRRPRDLMATGRTGSGFGLSLLFDTEPHRATHQRSFPGRTCGDVTVPAPVIYPLKEANRAHVDLAARGTTGVALDPAA